MVSYPESHDPVLIRLVRAAIRAPSGDNCQPWWFRLVNGNRIEIGLERTRATSFFDYRGCGSYLSIGAAIENIRVQAAAEGMGIRVAYRPVADREPRDNEMPVAVVDLYKDPKVTVPPAMVKAMLERTVNRRPFLPVAPPAAILGQLVSDPIEGTGVQVITRRRQIAQWAKVIELADRIRFSHPVIHEELFARILFSRDVAERVRVGLEVDRLGLGPLAAPLLRFLRPWERVQRLSRWGLIRLLAGHSRALAHATGALVLVTASAVAGDHWIRAGEQVQRLWIRAHERGLAVHPMTVAFYLDLRFREEGVAKFQPHHQRWLEEMRARLAELLPDGIGAMLFRLGKTWPMRRPAIRLPIERFLVW